MASSSSLSRSWQRFWFRPVSTAPVEVLRIAFGLLVGLWLLSLLPVFSVFFVGGGATPDTPVPRTGAWSLFTFVAGTPLVWVVWAIGLVASAALLLGYRARLAAVLVFIVVVSLQRQSPWVFNAGDSLIRVLAFYVMLMPVGSALSLDNPGVPRSGSPFPRRAPWALRLAQIQLSVIYLSTVWEKAGGSLWRNGTAVSYALRVDNVNRVRVPEWLTDSTSLMQLATYGTLAAEAALGILVWNRAARPWVLAVGVLLHVSIDLSLTIGFFSFAMMTLYLAFLPASTAERVMARVRSRLPLLQLAEEPGQLEASQPSPTPSSQVTEEEPVPDEPTPAKAVATSL